jgi:hypothetical protein
MHTMWPHWLPNTTVEMGNLTGMTHVKTHAYHVAALVTNSTVEMGNLTGMTHVKTHAYHVAALVTEFHSGDGELNRDDTR